MGTTHILYSHTCKAQDTVWWPLKNYTYIIIPSTSTSNNKK